MVRQQGISHDQAQSGALQLDTDLARTKEDLIAELRELRRQLELRSHGHLPSLRAGAATRAPSAPPPSALALHRIGDAFSFPLNLDLILDTIVQELRQLLNVASCSIWLIDAGSGDLVCRHATGPKSATLLDWRLRPGEGITGQVALTGESIAVTDAQADARHFRGIDEQTHLRSRSILATPLRVGSETIGVLEIIDTTPNRFHTVVLDLVEPIAKIGACAIASTQLFDENRRLSHFLRTVITSANVWVTVVDADGNVLIWNHQAEHVSGYDSDAVVGHADVWDWILPEQGYRDQIFGDIRAEFQRGAMLDGMEIPIRTVDGRTRIVAWHAVPLVDEAGDLIGAVAFGRDVTDQTRLQSELLKNQTLQSVGTLAGGIAHDFNNLLTGILGNVALARQSTKHDPDVTGMLADAEKASLRARDLTAQLLTFARGGAPVRKPQPLPALIERAARTARSPAGIELDVTVADDLWRAEVDERQLSQAIANIISHASRSMPEGGVISIRSENWTIEAGQGLPLPAGPCVRITIQDQGRGLAAEELPHVFDPYFSTIMDRQGLDMAVAYSVVRAHQGHISVESQPGHGTRFAIYLPARHPDARDAARPAEQTGGPGRPARILLMDDQRPVRLVASRMLAVLGHEVDLAADGAEAIEMYRAAHEGGTPYDLVITDLTVPGGMGGMEVIRLLLQIDPGVKAIVSSGYSVDPIMGNYRACGFQRVLVKPYQLAELEAVVEDVLAG